MVWILHVLYSIFLYWVYYSFVNLSSTQHSSAVIVSCWSVIKSMLLYRPLLRNITQINVDGLGFTFKLIADQHPSCLHQIIALNDIASDHWHVQIWFKICKTIEIVSANWYILLIVSYVEIVVSKLFVLFAKE
jgi:hypothetical protein